VVAKCGHLKISDMSKMKAEIAIPDEIVISKIFIVRGRKVMIDADLAELYAIKVTSSIR
jgi:hypothetical protein